MNLWTTSPLSTGRPVLGASGFTSELTFGHTRVLSTYVARDACLKDRHIQQRRDLQPRLVSGSTNCCHSCFAQKNVNGILCSAACYTRRRGIATARREIAGGQARTKLWHCQYTPATRFHKRYNLNNTEYALFARLRTTHKKKSYPAIQHKHPLQPTTKAQH